MGGGKPFIEGMLHEDLASTWEVIKGCEKICLVKGKLYLYFQGNNSSIHTKKVSRKFCEDYLKALIRRNTGISKTYYDFKREIAYSYLVHCPNIYMYANETDNTENLSLLKQEIIRLFKNNYRIGMTCKPISNKILFNIVIFRLSPRAYSIKYKISRWIKGMRI